mmetsp:Transcript_70603/g.140096  ORF Transcript_70603/g.140096 Transcript_70603/m.140096 type:complete len:166 (-) Transcript_70603:134-631(-)
MDLHNCHGRFLSVALLAIALIAIVCPPMAFVHGPSNRHAIENTPLSHVKGHHAQQQEREWNDTGAKFESEQNGLLASCRSLLVGVAFGLIVGSVGLASPSIAQKKASEPPPASTSEPMWKIAYHPEPLKPVKQPDAKEVALASGGYLGCLLKNNGSVSQCLNYGL